MSVNYLPLPQPLTPRLDVEPIDTDPKRRSHRWNGMQPIKDILQSDYCAQMLRLIGDPERLLIIQALRGGPKNVGEIGAVIGQKIANVSHHLKLLREGGLVESEREGRFVRYRLAPSAYIQSVSGSGSVDHLDIGCCRLEIPKSAPAGKQKSKA